MRTWAQEGDSVRIYPFTRLYENGVAVGIHLVGVFKSVRFGYLFRWLNVNVSIKCAHISTF